MESMKELEGHVLASFIYVKFKYLYFNLCKT